MQLTVLYSRRSRYAPLEYNYKHYLGFRKAPAPPGGQPDPGDWRARLVAHSGSID